ncbi:hypothetical protein MTO96_017418 [Rhipicephalus appendiculatus]
MPAGGFSQQVANPSSAVGFCEEFTRRAATGGRSRESGRKGENGEEGCDASLFRKESWDPAALSWDPASRSAPASLLSDGGLERKVYNRRGDSATEAPPCVAPSCGGPIKCRRGRARDRTETRGKYRRNILEERGRTEPGARRPAVLMDGLTLNAAKALELCELPQG